MWLIKDKSTYASRFVLFSRFTLFEFSYKRVYGSCDLIIFTLLYEK